MNALNVISVNVSATPSIICSSFVTKCPISVSSFSVHFIIRSCWPKSRDPETLDIIHCGGGNVIRCAELAFHHHEDCLHYIVPDRSVRNQPGRAGFFRKSGM